MKNKQLSSLGGLARNRSGQTIVVTAVLLPALLAVTGLVVDGGLVYQVKRRMQTAADAGAIGAAQEMWRGGSGTVVVSAARSDAALNGFVHDSNATVEVNRPPLAGPRSTDGRFVEVIVRRSVPTTFLRVINRNSTEVAARAVAGLINSADGCVMSLDPSERGALTVQGTSALWADCAVYVNSNDSRAINVNGGGCIYAGDVAVRGGWVSNGSANCINPPPSPEMPRALDPLAYLIPPLVTGLAVGVNTKITEGAVTLNPGRYVGGIEISGGTVTFSPGTYILDGGGLKITGNAVVVGNGVTFYNTNTGPIGLWGDFDIAGTVQADLRAPDSGPYEGMLFWNDSNAPNREPGSVIAGTSDSRLEGALYFPTTHVTWAGTSSTANWNMIIAATVTITGNAVVSSDYNNSTILPPTRKAMLIE